MARKPTTADTADTVAAGAIEGAGAVLEAGGTARDVAAGAIAGSAAATAEVLEGGTGTALEPIDDPATERVDDAEPDLNEALAGLGAAVDAHTDDDGEVVDEATQRMVDRLVDIASTAQLERGTLVGDVRDTLLDLFKANPKPWSALLEDQQKRVGDALEQCAKALIRSIVIIVAEDDAPAIHAKLESYAEKGGLKIALTATGDRDTVLALHDAVGQNVVLRRADSLRYSGQRRDPATMPDQPDLGFEDGEDRGDGGDPFGERVDPPEDDSDLAGDDDLASDADDQDRDD